jgi:hypothetical protein
MMPTHKHKEYAAMLNITSLTHPTMIAKIRLGLKLAALGKGSEMGGHANRVYIQNRKGHNIMRIDWKGNGKFVAYGGADWGRTEVTDIVKAALKRANVTYTTIKKEGVVVAYKKRDGAAKLFMSAVLAVACMFGNPSDMAQYMPNPQAMQQACAKTPQSLVCERMLVKL